jgi:hypothetical protein
MIDDGAEAQGLEALMDLAIEGVRKAVLRLLRDGEVHPQLVGLAVARVAGELGDDVARLGDVDLETVLGNLVREAGRAHAEGPPVAGSA